MPQTGVARRNYNDIVMPDMQWRNFRLIVRQPRPVIGLVAKRRDQSALLRLIYSVAIQTVFCHDDIHIPPAMPGDYTCIRMFKESIRLQAKQRRRQARRLGQLWRLRAHVHFWYATRTYVRCIGFEPMEDSV